MLMFFDTLDHAVLWLTGQGWRQDDTGVWLKGKRRADIRRSPVGDDVVCIAITRA